VTSDLWESEADDDYLGTTFHYVDAEWLLVSRTLCLKHVQVNKTAENLKELLDSSLADWKANNKVFIFIFFEKIFFCFSRIVFILDM
jgi:hypothetical protein